MSSQIVINITGFALVLCWSFEHFLWLLWVWLSVLVHLLSGKDSEKQHLFPCQSAYKNDDTSQIM